MAKTLIEIALGILLIGWVVYPCAMYAVAAMKRGARAAQMPGKVTASVVIATRDDAALVSRRIANLEELRHELQALEIIIAVDRSGRTAAAAYRAELGGRVIVVDGDSPGGKAATLNAGVRAATQDIVIFADSAQQFLPGAMQRLVTEVSKLGVGAATGRLVSEADDSRLVLRIFWAYESWLRRTESAVDSIVGVTGAIYAVRKSLWKALPAGLINDDLYVPLSIVQQGSRAVTCENALAVDTRVFAPRDEFQRKVRTLTGILQLCALRPSILNPMRNRVWMQFVCHKLLRFATPYWILLGAIGILLALPAQTALFAVLFAGAVIAIAVISAPRDSMVARMLRQVGWTALILAAPFVATLNGLKGNWNVWGAPGSGTK